MIILVTVGIAIIFAIIFTSAGTGNVLAIIAGALIGALIMAVLIIIITTYFRVTIQGGPYILLFNQCCCPFSQETIQKIRGLTTKGKNARKK